MIDVPVLVKDALREGSYKKNYRFVVQKEITTRAVSGVAELTTLNSTFTVLTTDEYVLYNENSAQAFDYVTVTAGGASMQVQCPVGDTETWVELGSLGAGTTITVHSLNVDALHVTTLSRVTYTTSYVDDFVIDNNNLVSESVSIDERMCSGDTLKFGLCEGASLEFRYFGLANITGRRIQAFIDVQYEGVTEYVKISDFEPQLEETIVEGGDYRAYSATANAWYKTKVTSGLTPTQLTPTTENNETIQVLDGLSAWDSIEIDWGSINPYEHPVELQKKVDTPIIGPKWHIIPIGFFTVSKCSRQASTGIIKVTAYNKLQSDYLDAKANPLFEDIKPDSYNGEISVYTILANALADYGIIDKPKESIQLEVVNTSGYAATSDTSITFTMPGYTGTRYADVGSSASCLVNDGRYFELNTMVEIGDISDFITLLEEAIYYWHYDVNRYVNNPNTLWNKLKDWYGAFRYGFSFVFYNDDGTLSDRYYYTLPEMISGTNDHYRDIHLLNHIRLKNIALMHISIPTIFWGMRNTTNGDCVWDGSSRTIPEHMFDDKIFIIDGSEFSAAEKIMINIEDLPDVTLRELQTASYETVCQFGQLSRETDLFSGVELNHSRLFPADGLYPHDGLYPSGAALSSFKSTYSKLWADEGNIHKWRYLIITYKGLDGEGHETDFTLQRTVNADGTDDYNMSDNWLFKNLVWTAADVGDYADAMVAKMQDVTWFPFEMWCAGLPYLETGDEIEISLGETSYTSYILQRQLKGIQNLQDTYINGTLDIF